MITTFQRHRTTVFLVTAIALWLISAAVSAQQEATASADAAPPYSKEQAELGHGLFAERCASCHGQSLSGTASAPALVGDDFASGWSGKTIGDLFTTVRQTMPADNPRTLTPDEAADAIAYILSQNKWPAGDKELPSDPTALKQFRVVPQNKP
jgi:mono/diheme cytochrome c family protein